MLFVKSIDFLNNCEWRKRDCVCDLPRSRIEGGGCASSNKRSIAGEIIQIRY